MSGGFYSITLPGRNQRRKLFCSERTRAKNRAAKPAELNGQQEKSGHIMR